MKWLLMLIALISLTSCTSSKKNETISAFQRLEKIPLGTPRVQVLKIMGPPAEVEPADSGTRTTYTIPYKNYNLPKVIIWYDKDDRVEAKHINLFEDDSMDRKKIESYFRSSKFTVTDAPIPKNGHTIPSEKYMEDSKNGIFVEINSARDDRARYIRWSVPAASAVSASK